MSQKSSNAEKILVRLATKRDANACIKLSKTSRPEWRANNRKL